MTHYCYPTDFSSVGGGNACGRVGYGRKGGGVPSVIDTLTKLEEEKIKGGDVTRQSSGSGQATTQLQSPKPLSHTHTQVLKNDAYKIGRGILSMEESRNFIVVPCRHGKWEIEFARFLWNAGPSLYSFAFLVSHASIIIGQCCHAI